MIKSCEIPCGNKLLLKLELRTLVLSIILPVSYALAAVVGNDWGYLIPAAIAATLLIGIVTPLLEIFLIRSQTSVSQSRPGEAQIEVKLLHPRLLPTRTSVVPIGALNVQLRMHRKTWKARQKKEDFTLPLIFQEPEAGIQTLTIKTPQLPRGVFSAAELEIESCFPFAIARWSRKLKCTFSGEQTSLTIYPNVYPLAGNFHQRLLSALSASGQLVGYASHLNQSLALRGLREFSERDNLNHMHWPSVAKTGKLMVREFEIESLPGFDIMLDLTLPWKDEHFELAVAAALSLFNYGLTKGLQPQIFLTPSIDSELLSELMDDLPVASRLAPSEIMARIQPIPKELQKNQPANRDTISSRKESLLTLYPASDTLKINLAILSTIHTEVSTASAQILGSFSDEAELSRL